MRIIFAMRFFLLSIGLVFGVASSMSAQESSPTIASIDVGEYSKLWEIESVSSWDFPIPVYYGGCGVMGIYHNYLFPPLHARVYDSHTYSYGGSDWWKVFPAGLPPAISDYPKQNLYEIN